MTHYEPSLVKDFYRESFGQTDTERVAQRLSRQREMRIERTRESRGINGLLAWAEGMAIVRRAF